MPRQPSDRSDIAPFIVMDVLARARARAREGHDVLHLEAGQPSTKAPQAVRDAVAEALKHDKVGYTDALGMLELREALVAHYQRRYGVTIAADRVVITMGSSSGFILSFLACFGPGDRVAMVTPGYPAYRNILQALGVEVVVLPAGPEHRYQPTVALLDGVDGPLDGVIVASPSNPTGTMVGPDEMGALADWCRDHDAWLISDEIYHGITYGTPEATALAHDPDAVVINSFSKYFSMTGWRLGWLVLPEALVRPVERLAQNLFISAPTLSQVGAIASFGAEEELQANVARYAENRRILLEGLPPIGLPSFAPPDGAFYLYVDVSAYTDDSTAWCARLLDETGVAATPGTDFDPERGHRFVRFSFAGSPDEMHEAVRRLGAWLPPTQEA